MYALSLFQTPIEFKIILRTSYSKKGMANDNFNSIFVLLRSLSRISKQNVRENLLKCNEKIRGLKEWQKTAIEHLQNSGQVKKNDKVKSIPQTFKSKRVRSVSFPVGKKYKSKKNVSFFNKREYSKHARPTILAETPKVPDKRRTRSFSQDMLKSYEAKSEKELLEMHGEVTIRYDKIFHSPDVTEIGASKRKSIIELLETGGVKAKKITKPPSSSSSGTIVNSSEGDSFTHTFCEKTGYTVNETPLSTNMHAEILLNTSGVKSKVFLERLSVNGGDSPELFGEPPVSSEATSLEDQQKTCSTSHLQSANPVSRLEATFNIEIQNSTDGSSAEKKGHGAVKISDADCKTPLRPRISNGLRKSSLKAARLSPSMSDSRIIKKKNLTSYLNSKTVEHVAISQPEKPTQEINGMKLRLRERPVLVKEIKPITKKPKRTRSNEEELESKLKRREESIKQQKLELQVKAEERRQRREERMRKTKEAREKLEKERLEKVQISGGVKRQRTDSVKEGEFPKKMRTRQNTKQNTEEKTVVKLKVSKKRKSSTTTVKRKQKPKRSLTTVSEAESEAIPSTAQKRSSRLPKKTKPKTGKRTAKSKAANSTFSLKNAASSEEPVVYKSSSPGPALLSSEQPHPTTSATFVCNTTFVAQTSPIANKQPLPATSKKTPGSKTPAAAKKTSISMSKEIATPFKIPAVTPLPKSKESKDRRSSLRKRHSSTFNYEITPCRGDDEDSNEEEDEPKKPIPNWASGIRLKEAIIKQAYNPPNIDKLFGPLKPNINLVDIFGRNHRKYRKRTSSAVWKNISFSLDESMSQHNNSTFLLP